jgi:transposase
MDQIVRIGMDLSKQVFQLHGVNAAEAPILRRRLRRAQVIPFFTALPSTVIGIEAGGAAHYWSRALSGLGHKVQIIAAQFVRPYVKRNKNDAADAEAICEAISRPTMRFVQEKTAQQQAALMLLSIRDRLIRTRTQLTNSIRGHASEFGIVSARGVAKILPLLAQISTDENVPALARSLFAKLGDELAELQARINQVDGDLMRWHRQSERCQRLAQIPGVGPVGASMLSLKAPDPACFQSARHFAAWIGLTPKDHSTGDATRLGGITRAGDSGLRSVLVTGATALIRQSLRKRGQHWPWLQDMLARKPVKLVAIALANKIARIAWKLMTSGDGYNPALTMRAI